MAGGSGAYGFRVMPVRTVLNMPSPVSSRPHQLRSRRAFTLIEIVIVIVVLGIISVIAIAGYQQVINRAKESSTSATLAALGREVLTVASMDENSVPMLSDVQEVLVYDTPGQDGPNPGADWTAHDTPGGFSTGPEELHYASSLSAAGLAWQHSPGQCTLVKVSYGTRPEWSGALAAEDCTGDTALLLPVEPGS